MCLFRSISAILLQFHLYFLITVFGMEALASHPVTLLGYLERIGSR